MKFILHTLAIFTAVQLWAQDRTLTLEEAMTSRSLRPASLYMADWNPHDGALYYFDIPSRQFKKYALGGEVTQAFSTADMVSFLGNDPVFIGIEGWKDANTFLFVQEGSLYRYDISTKKGTRLSEVPEGAENNDLHLSTGNMAYTKGNNLYLITPGGAPMAITENDEDGAVVSGQSIARQEFGIQKGIFWNKAGDALAFYEKDESNINQYPLLDVTKTPGETSMLRYPMTGQPSELARVGVYHIPSKQLVYLDSEKGKEDYMTNVGWSPDGKYVTVAEVNRGQNHMKLKLYDAKTGKLVRILHEEKNDRWVEPEHATFFINDKEYLWMSEKDGFMNIYKGHVEKQGVSPVTAHNWVVKEILDYDPAKGVVYYSGTGPSPIETHAYATTLKNGKTKTLTTEPGVHHVSVSKDFKSIFDSYSSLSVPGMSVVKDAKGKVVKTLVESDDPLEGMRSGTVELLQITAADGTTPLHARMVKPSDFDADKKYPVLVYVYGGPHAQLVENAWNGSASLWMNALAEQGYIVFTVDNRGSANRGYSFESGIHRQLGTLEVEDQLKGLEYLKGLPYVDTTHMAVHGWSFGGFMTLNLMLKTPGNFTTGVAGGPVTDWKYYEVMYGERYMDTPQENPDGYAKASLLDKAGNLEGDLLMIHGTIDPVVVMQHSFSLVKSFVDAGIQMEFFPYPGHEHNVRGKDRLHLMQKVIGFVIEHNGPGVE